MNIEKNINGSSISFSLEGWLDTTTAPMLGEELKTLDESVTSLVLDFEKLEYISSAGLRQVVSAYNKMKNKEFKIINVSNSVMEIFKMAGFDKKLDISEQA